MHRSLITIDLAAIRHNARTLRGLLAGAELWAVVKADGYGHGATDVGRVALEEGATALCVATVPEALELRAVLPEARIIVLGDTGSADLTVAREARLELGVSTADVPAGVPVHLKLDTGMGRWGVSELAAPGSGVVGVMSHFASADTDPEYTAVQLERFLEATASVAHLQRHIANSAGTLLYAEAHLDAVRCGIALYGISPFGTDAAEDGLQPALRWESSIALVKTLGPGDSTGYGRRFVATRPTRIGIVPVGYADGFRRSMSGTEVVVAGSRAVVVGTVSMDAIAIALPAGAEAGDRVTLVGEGVVLEEHARVSGTIPYEIACGIVSRATRSERVIVDE
ncbi:alanine racemase [Gaiella sp.]|uniref:alanine racemase n=1 Tax=Gaiella sp. TaxID=2663207 RepID=UPI003263E887